jgi:hypothetical protein
MGLIVLPFAHTSQAATHIEVRGSGRLQAEAVNDRGDLVMLGTLSDDTGRGLAGERVRLSLESVAPEEGRTIEGLRGAVSCGRGDKPTFDRDAAVLRTDEGGRFCARVPLAATRYRAFVRFAGKGLIEAAQVEVPFDLSRQTLSLRFDPKPEVLHLGNAAALFDLIAEQRDGDITRPVGGRRLVLTSGAGTDALFEGVTNGSGRVTARFSMDRLPPPGRGKLMVTFPGDSAFGPAAQTIETERRAHVVLKARAPEAARSPDEGIPIEVDASYTHGARSLPVDEGAIEVRAFGVVVGAAPVVHGHATVTAMFAPQSAAQTQLSLQYLPASPWFQGHGATEVTVQLKGASPFRRAPLVLAAVAAILALAWARRRPKMTSPAPPPAKDKSTGQPGIEVVAEGPRSARNSPLGGTVQDAHDGTALTGAKVTLERPGFQGNDVIASAITDAEGRFSLGVTTMAGDFLVAEAPLHARHIDRAPGRGQVTIRLVLRKRKVLETLVQWAKRRGAPFDGKPEPTPAHVRKAAGDNVGLQIWADEVEQAAFDDRAVDETAEARIEDLRNRALGQAPVAAQTIADGSPEPRRR